MSQLGLERGGSNSAQGKATVAPQDPAPAELPEPVFASSEDWLVSWLLPTILSPRSEKQGKWCPKWFLHPEVVCRIDGLWRVWELCAAEGPPATLNWWRDHFDHHWPQLTSVDGPMGSCGTDRHHMTEPLTVSRRPQFNPEQFLPTLDAEADFEFDDDFG